MERLYTKAEAAKLMGGVSARSLENWLARGTLLRTKVGSRCFIAESEIERFIVASTAAANVRTEQAVA